MGWTRSRSASDGNPPDNALTRRLLQSTGIPTFPQPSFGPMTRQKGQRPDPIPTSNPSSGGREWSGRRHTTTSPTEAYPSRLQFPNHWIQPARLPVQGEAWTGERYTTTVGFRLPASILQSRWSQDHQLVCFVSQEFSSLLQLPFPALSHGQQVMRAVRFGRRPCDFNQTTRIRSRHRALG